VKITSELGYSRFEVPQR